MIPRRPAICGVPITILDMRGVVEHIFELIDLYRLDEKPKYVATVNVDFLRNTFGWRPLKVKNPELLRALWESDINTPDGMPIVWLGKLLGIPIVERVAGSDLLFRLCKQAAERKKSVYLFGGGGDVGKRAADKLCQKYRGLKIAGVSTADVHTSGPGLETAEEDDAEIVGAINRSGAEILFISLGNPKQEIWFRRIRHKLKVPVAVGVGGSFAFAIGEVPRAPAWMQKFGLEWIYRLYTEPARLWKRYFVGFFHFIWLAIPCLAAEWIARVYSIVGPKESEQNSDGSLLPFAPPSQFGERLSASFSSTKNTPSSLVAAHLSCRTLRMARLSGIMRQLQSNRSDELLGRLSKLNNTYNGLDLNVDFDGCHLLDNRVLYQLLKLQTMTTQAGHSLNLENLGCDAMACLSVAKIDHVQNRTPKD